MSLKKSLIIGIIIGIIFGVIFGVINRLFLGLDPAVAGGIIGAVSATTTMAVVLALSKKSKE